MSVTAIRGFEICEIFIASAFDTSPHQGFDKTERESFQFGKKREKIPRVFFKK